ncbi:DUF4838 domain-containing protein [Cohnella sp. GCM10012308]|uniref:DUF4838 domain-containing protein n=1 Tax=Cohnella sp. GCM10012308 TaxID=3317329 RepID=UPI00362224AC
MNPLIRIIDGGGEPVAFAAEQLKVYLSFLSEGEIAIARSERYRPDEPGIWIGLQEAFSYAPDEDRLQSESRDAIRIDIREGNGILSGSNPGSVLLAVYRYLQELGCRWVRPGKDGEVIPRRDYRTRTVRISEQADFKYRGICLEGAVSVENVLEMIDWLPKAGFNGYFIQFREGYVFFERWYHHLRNPGKETSGLLDLDAASAYVERAAAEIRKRGLTYHAIGHGWTCTALGIPGLGWDRVAGEAAPEIKPYLAEVDGKRDWWRGVPLDTELCYSNPAARTRMTEEIVRYALDHPDIDLLHVWLSDGHNNQCECASCRLATPSDWYVLLLNELDDALTANGIKTRIAFLLYQELLWPPQRERIRRPDRFVLMFAPITRPYGKTFAEAEALPALSPFERNAIRFPLTIEDNLAYLKGWQDVFPGEGFDFDYHFMWAHQKDPGQMSISRVLHEDIRHLHDIGLQGYVSCQVQRAFFPHGLGLTVMGRTLWNRHLSFEEIAGDYFLAAYGEDGFKCRDYMTALSALFEKLDLDRTTNRTPDAVFSDGAFSSDAYSDAAIIEAVQAELRRFEPVIGGNLSAEIPCHAASWAHLKYHREVWLSMTEALKHLYGGRAEEALAGWNDLKNSLWDNEEAYQPVLDVFNFTLVFDGVFSGSREAAVQPD